MKNPILLLSLAAIALLTSCGERNDVEYIPFQEREDGRWGLVGTDGKVLFSEEFERRPSVVTNGRFVAETKDGRYEIYTAEEKPKTVGGRYVDAGYYQDGLIPVAEEGGHVKYLDTDGAEAFTLSKVEGKDVTRASVFSEGLAVFEAGGYYGAVDTKGHVVIKPEYIELEPCHEGKLLGINKRYEQAEKAREYEKMRASILDSNGEEIGTFTFKEETDCWDHFSDGVMAFSGSHEGKWRFGLIDEKGNTLMELSDYRRRIEDVQGDFFTFSDFSLSSRKWGVMNRKGEVVISAKYDELYFAGDGILAVKDEAYDEDMPWYFIDTDGNRLGRDSYIDVTEFYDGKHAFARYSDRNWILLGTDGEQVECEADIYLLVPYKGKNWVVSDHVDADAIVSQFGITTSGVGTYRVGMTAKEAIAATCQGGSAASESPDTYYNDNDLSYWQDLHVLMATYRIVFPNYISEEITETNNNDTIYNHEMDMDYRFRTQQAERVGIVLDLSRGRMADKADNFYDAIEERVRSLGSVVKWNYTTLLVRAGNNTLLAYHRGTEVGCLVMAGDRSDLDIGEYTVFGDYNLSTDDVD